MFDRLADPTTTIAAFDGKVSLFWENEEVIRMLRRVNGWNENGWIYPDSIFGTAFNDDLMRDGICFSFISDTEIGVESQKLNATGYECICPMAYQGMIVTSTLVNMGVAIPVTAQEPEAAAKFINALYTRKDLINLLDWGIEGEDYIVNGSSEACYPESGPGAYHAGDFLIGSQMNALPWEGNGGDFRERAMQANASAEVTPYLGFMINAEGMDTLIAFLSAVTDQYKPQLLCGQYSDELAAEYVSRLQDAGLEEYISAVQQQLDAFLQAQ